MAILSLIKLDLKVEKYRKIAVICIIGAALLGLFNNLFLSSIKSFKTLSFVNNIRRSLNYTASLAKYAAIIFCLTHDNFVSNIFKTDIEEKTIPVTNTISTTGTIVQNTTQVTQPVASTGQTQPSNNL